MPKLQTYHGFYEQKPQKPRLEILGSLIFLAGLTLSKPACAAPKVSSAALSVSPTNQRSGEVITAAATDAAAIPSHPEALPQVERGKATPLWSQPTQGSIDAAVQKTSIQEIAKELSLNPPNSSFLPVLPSVSGESSTSLLNDSLTQKAKEGEKALQTPVIAKSITQSSLEQAVTESGGGGETGRREDGEIETNPIQGGQSRGLGMRASVNSPFSTFCLSSPPAPTTDALESSSGISSVTGQPLVLSPELKSLCNPQLSNRDGRQGHEEVGTQESQEEGTSPRNPSHGVLTAQAGNAFPSELQPSGSPNSSEPQQPTQGQDPELGNLHLRELAAPPPPSQPSVYLLGGVGYFRSNNIFSGIDPVEDGLFRTGLTLLAVPSLGPKTSLFASVGGNITRYSERSLYDYNELNFNLGVRQQLGSRSYGELGWNNRQLFSRESGDRFLDDHSVYLELGRRDSLTNRLSLDTFYQARLSFANPSDRSQVINYLGASLNYSPAPSLELALDYQFAIADFTKQDRLDQYHQLIARLSYTMSRNSRFYLFGGHSFGNSSDSSINFDGLVFGAGVDFNLSLF
ncbi:MAG TPA: hypothetical protein V6D11_20260 [Waterburya sp.]